MHPVHSISLVLIHACPAMRSGLRQFLELAGMVRVVLELDGLERVRSSWPVEGVQVVMLHVGHELAPVLELVRWFLRLPDPPAVLAVGELTPRVGGRLADAGVRALLHANAAQEEFRKAVTLLAAGGIFPNSQWDAQRVSPRTGHAGRAPKGQLQLTERLEQVLRLLCDPADLSYAAIGERLGIQKSTVCHHRDELFDLFGKRTRYALVCAAFTGGYVGKR